MENSVITKEQLRDIYIPQLRKMALEDGYSQADSYISSISQKLNEVTEFSDFVFLTSKLAEFCSDIRHYDKAKELYEKAITLALTVDTYSKRRLYNLYADYGLVFEENWEYDEAICLMRKAMDILTSLDIDGKEGIKGDAASICLDLGNCYYKKVINRKEGNIVDIDTARCYFVKGIKYAESYNGSEDLSKLINRLDENIKGTYDILCDNGYFSGSWAEDALNYYEEKIQKRNTTNDEIISGFELDYCRRKLALLRFMKKEDKYESFRLHYLQLKKSYEEYWLKKNNTDNG